MKIWNDLKIKNGERMNALLLVLKNLSARLQQTLNQRFESPAGNPTAGIDFGPDAFDGALSLAVRANLSGFNPRY